MKKTQSLPLLSVCILMDVLGYATFSIPFLGELADVLWAPLSAFVFAKMFGGRFGRFGAALNFMEEILPFTDFIPSFTIAWGVKYFFTKDKSPTTIVRTSQPLSRKF